MLHHHIFALLLCVGTVFAADRLPCPADKAPASRTWQEELRCSKTLQIEAASSMFSADKMIAELLKLPEPQELGYIFIRHVTPWGAHESKVAKNKDGAPTEAVVLLRVTRKSFTTRFTVELVNPVTHRIYVADTASSLGGTIEPKLAKIVVKWIREANGVAEKK